jgi:hypothetical protein
MLLVVLAILLAISLKIIFYRADLLTIAKVAVALLWLFVLPGYALLLAMHSSLPFYARLGLGICVGVAVYGLASYYLGIMGVHVRLHRFLIPTAVIALGGALLWWGSKEAKHQE